MFVSVWGGTASIQKTDTGLNLYGWQLVCHGSELSSAALVCVLVGCCSIFYTGFVGTRISSRLHPADTGCTQCHRREHAHRQRVSDVTHHSYDVAALVTHKTYGKYLYTGNCTRRNEDREREINLFIGKPNRKDEQCLFLSRENQNMLQDIADLTLHPPVVAIPSKYTLIKLFLLYPAHALIMCILGFFKKYFNKYRNQINTFTSRSVDCVQHFF